MQSGQGEGQNRCALLKQKPCLPQSHRQQFNTVSFNRLEYFQQDQFSERSTLYK